MRRITCTFDHPWTRESKACLVRKAGLVRMDSRGADSDTRTASDELPGATAASALMGRRRRRAYRLTRSGGRCAHSAIPPTGTPSPQSKLGQLPRV